MKMKIGRVGGFKIGGALLMAALMHLSGGTHAIADEYQGGGYQVTIEGFAGDAKYTGCDPKGQCVTIEEASNYEKGRYVWENNGYTYSMSPVRGGKDPSNGNYMLRIIDPSGKVILKQLLAPVPDTGKDGD
jgi:hypothetical protein